MTRSGVLTVVAALAAAIPGRADAQTMSVSSCETPSSRLSEALGIVPGAAIDDGAFIVANASGCSTIPVVSGQSVRGPFARALHAARDAAPRSDRNRVIVYVNGMRVTPEIHCDSLRAIAASTGATVVGVHNATDGFASDLMEVFGQRELIAQRRAGGPLAQLGPSGNRAVSTVRRLLVASALDGTSPPEIWAHSQGGVITSLALYEARDVLEARKEGLGKEQLSRAKVVTFASAAPFWPSGPSYEHYVHGEDVVPRYTGLGRLDWFDDRKAGANAQVIRFSGERHLASGHVRAAGLPDLAHHDILEFYLPRYLREHGGRPAALIDWETIR